MKFIKDYKDGDRVFDIYLCKRKSSAVTKNGKPYDTVILQDRTGTLEAKIWDPGNPGIGESLRFWIILRCMGKSPAFRMRSRSM